MNLGEENRASGKDGREEEKERGVKEKSGQKTRGSDRRDERIW